MITLYGAPSPNPQKVSIMLHELGLEHRVIPIDIFAGEQLTPEFLALNPNNKLPVLTDRSSQDGPESVVWESGAILIYLAETYGRFLASSGPERFTTIQWLMFQMSGLGPMGGQFAHFAFYAKEKLPYATERYFSEVRRLYAVMDRHLAGRRYFATDYSIADMAIYPWYAATAPGFPDQFLNLSRWAEDVGSRPAVKKGMDLLSDKVRKETIAGGLAPMDDTTWTRLFGNKHYG